MRLKTFSLFLWPFWLVFAPAATTKAVDAGNTSLPWHLTPLKYANTSTLLNVAYYEAGPPNGSAVILVHGFPYSIDAFASVVPLLTGKGYRVIVPYLRGYGETSFLYPDTPRSAEQAALGSDLIALMDAIHIDKAIFAGYDWGTVVVNVAAALWPERCNGHVAANSYLIQNRSTAWVPLDPDSEALRWYYYVFLTARGAAGLASNPKAWARSLWQKNSIGWNFSEEYLDLTATAFENTDYVDIVLNFYRNRLLYAPGDPKYSALALRLDVQPPISARSVTFDPQNSVVFPPTNGTATAKYFTGSRCHYVLPNVGENVPYQAPKMFANAIFAVDNLPLHGTDVISTRNSQREAAASICHHVLPFIN
ncbi:hydrolase, putative [Talaromyces stipitatus ATCC 10500]|uniref:Hydrolase, putative n=1 Tax=Talaromyces stipitatus (strain ATCC 10500 / CBS 375.48 / QM 6759 / NRRL 1006) TaxID=441959 RepID=B8LVK9_TALSN|nr:hydrolase, putative [Talaromyces stipitatus ATCC 10500]EED24028.1 hydrolase, putative [Talaromyces stipitatus ATCC 10500]